VRAAVNLLRREQCWLIEAKRQAEAEAAGADLATFYRLRDNIRQLGAEVAEITEALAVLAREG